jgi:iron complex outermembrane receptor protein
MWDVVVGFLQMQDLDLSGLPPPTSDQVRTDLRILNDATFEFDPVDPTGITDIQPLKAVIDNTFEMGYKGIRDDKLLITADLYYNRIENGSATIMATPNVFFDPGSLETYLSAFLPAENAAGLAGVIAEIPLGTVTPREAGEQDPGDLMFTDRNLSRTLSLYGADLSLTYYAGPNWQLQGAYSYLSKDFFEKEDFTLNAPRHKFSGSIQYLHPESGLDARLGLRYVHGFPFFGGVYRGRVESYTVLDFTADYPLPFSRQTHLTLSVQNLLNNKHREFVGAPEIKRLSLVRISHSF